jgi:hypothetical protein
VAAQRKQARFDRVKVRYDEHFAAGHLTAAEVLLRELLALTPAWAAGWFDLGLITKLRRDWAGSREANDQALTLGDGKPGDPAAWNLGIAATALGDWPTARRAWAAYGIELPPGEGPIRAELGLVPIRLNPEPRTAGQRPLLIDGAEHGTEVVWTQRISPAHAVVASVPLPGSGHRYGDVVLHDGEPVGSRELDGRSVPVFEELERLAVAPHPTTAVTVTTPAEADAVALLTLLADGGLSAADWTASVRRLCRTCSEGIPDGTHGHEPGAWVTERSVGIAGQPERAVTLLERWAADGVGRSWERA